MSYVFQDFVDREENLRLLHQSVEQLKWRIVLIQGRTGIGKTFLLNEFLTEARGGQVNAIAIDLGQRFTAQSYLSIILEVRRQMGFTGFERLDHAFEEARSYLPHASVLRAPVVEETELARPPAGGQAGKPGLGVIFNGPVDAPNSQFAGGNIYNIQQIILSGDPYDQEITRAKITQAFLEDLHNLSQACTLVIILDHWEKANQETRDWLAPNLLQWTLNQHSPRIIFVVVSQGMPEWYQNRADITTIELAELPEEAVRLYWIEKKGLPETSLGPNLGIYGYPPLLALFATETARSLKRSKA